MPKRIKVKIIARDSGRRKFAEYTVTTTDPIVAASFVALNGRVLDLSGLDGLVSLARYEGPNIGNEVRSAFAEHVGKGLILSITRSDTRQSRINPRGKRRPHK